MRANIHPEYSEIKVTCSCGHKFEVGSALCKDLHIEVCNECHPFYTGKQKIVDTAGRVERFKGKFGATSLNKNKEEKDAAPLKEEKKEHKIEKTEAKTGVKKEEKKAPVKKSEKSDKKGKKEEKK